VAGFTSDAPQCFGAPAQFTDASTGAPASWAWDFGDGDTSTAQNPSHAYASPGAYQVTLIATNVCGASVQYSATVAVTDAPTANFVSAPTACVNNPVAFTDASTGTPTSWSWDFGDGDTSTAQNPQHAYASPGTYTVTLVATNACGASAAVSKDVAILEVPAASFTHDAPKCKGQSVQFTNASSASATGWSWNFGDGVGVSGEEHPAYAYSDAGARSIRRTPIPTPGPIRSR
jgi:PKD repeat protein